MAALSVVGDVPPNAIQPTLPDGVHLRWSFAPARGFPWNGYYLFRRPARRRKPTCLARWYGHQEPGTSSQSTLDTPVGRWSSDRPLVFIDQFSPNGVTELALAQREWLRFDLNGSNHAHRAVARIGFIAHRCRWYTVARELPATWSDRGVTMRWMQRDGGQLRAGRIATVGGVTGVDCSFNTELQFEHSCDEIALDLVAFEGNATIIAFDSRGTEVARGHVAKTGPRAEHVDLRGRGIVRVMIHAPHDRTLLVELCSRPERERTEQVEVVAFSGDVEVSRRLLQGAEGEIVEAQLEGDAITALRFSGASAAVIDLCLDLVETSAIAGWKPVTGFTYPMPLPVAHGDYLCPNKPSTVISPAADRVIAIGFTAHFTYPFPVLEQLRTGHALTPAEWRQVGDNQKALYFERLKVRAGHGGTSAEPPFEFNDPDQKNIFQLEAVAEFYANFPDPWLAGAAPRSRTVAALSGNAATPAGGFLQLDGTPNLTGIQANHDLIFLASSDHPSRMYRIIEVNAAAHRVRIEGMTQAAVPAAGSAWRIEPFQVVDLLDPAGAQATVNGSVITLDGTADLTRIWPNDSGANDPVHDTIVLDAIPQGQTRVFRIRSCDIAARTVTVSGAPALPGASSAWRINLRPWLVVVDPIGNRLKGSNATISATHPDRIMLDLGVALNRVNINFDTIYLPTDTSANTPRRTYRILEVNNASHWVRVHANPTLAAAGPWHIQAGISGEVSGVVYAFTPGGARGTDHFDAMLFLVHNNEVKYSMQWNTYTSRNKPNYDQARSTIRGNKMYEYLSFRSSRSLPSRSNPYVPCNAVAGAADPGRPFRNYSLKLVDAGAAMRPGWPSSTTACARRAGTSKQTPEKMRPLPRHILSTGGTARRRSDSTIVWIRARRVAPMVVWSPRSITRCATDSRAFTTPR